MFSVFFFEFWCDAFPTSVFMRMGALRPKRRQILEALCESSGPQRERPLRSEGLLISAKKTTCPQLFLFSGILPPQPLRSHTHYAISGATQLIVQ